MPKNVYSLQLWYCSDSCFIFCTFRTQKPMEEWGCSALKIWANNLVTPKNQGTLWLRKKTKFLRRTDRNQRDSEISVPSIASWAPKLPESWALHHVDVWKWKQISHSAQIWWYSGKSHDSLVENMFFFVLCLCEFFPRCIDFTLQPNCLYTHVRG